MQRIILTSLLFWMMSIASIEAQTAPKWCNHNLRSIEYPHSEYFTGYAEGTIVGDERIDVATQRLKDAARVEAASSIRVHVQSTTTNQTLSENIRSSNGTFRKSLHGLTSTATTQVEMEIPGLQIESWHNPQTGTVAAFAYVKKSSLIRQLEKQITVALTKVEMSLEQVEQLISVGQKLQAQSAAEKALPLFAGVDEAQQLLVAVDADATEETLMLPETRELQLRMIAMVTQLENALTICIQCDARIFSSTYSTLQYNIKGHLSQLGCNFVDDPSVADWVIDIQSQAREYNVITSNGEKTYFVYVDARISIIRTATNQCIYENMFSEKGGHTRNNELAAMDAYELLTPKLYEVIEEIVKQ